MSYVQIGLVKIWGKNYGEFGGTSVFSIPGILE
jgi:hypothetical protein